MSEKLTFDEMRTIFPKLEESENYGLWADQITAAIYFKPKTEDVTLSLVRARVAEFRTTFESIVSEWETAIQRHRPKTGIRKLVEAL